MGAGAGYNIRGTIDYDSIKINSFEVNEPFTVTEKLSGGYTHDYQVIQIKCDIDCAAENVVSESYYDSGTLHGFTPIKITEISLIPGGDDIEDISEIDESVIRDALDGLKFDAKIGGGWIHSKFTGDISCDTNDLEENSYTDFYFNEIIMHITNKYAIEALDIYATGDNYVDHYYVDDSNDYGEYFDDLESAISYAEENNGYQVWSIREWYTYEISDDGYVYDYDLDIEEGSNLEWENPNYIDED